MGEIIDWWKPLSTFKKVTYGSTFAAVSGSITYYFWINRRFFYDPSKKKKHISKWE